MEITADVKEPLSQMMMMPPPTPSLPITTNIGPSPLFHKQHLVGFLVTAQDDTTRSQCCGGKSFFTLYITFHFFSKDSVDNIEKKSTESNNAISLGVL
jgi:hypothetical protein